jgi:hypothetical protein
MLDVLIGYAFVISASLVSFVPFTIVNKSIATITAFIDFERRLGKKVIVLDGNLCKRLWTDMNLSYLFRI